jgi:hypothetical protein
VGKEEYSSVLSVALIVEPGINGIGTIETCLVASYLVHVYKFPSQRREYDDLG